MIKRKIVTCFILFMSLIGLVGCGDDNTQSTKEKEKIEQQSKEIERMKSQSKENEEKQKKEEATEKEQLKKENQKQEQEKKRLEEEQKQLKEENEKLKKEQEKVTNSTYKEEQVSENINQNASNEQVEVRANSKTKVYHTPGGQFYEQMGSSKNLVTFNSPQEAEAAGYRPSKK